MEIVPAAGEAENAGRFSDRAYRQTLAAVAVAPKDDPVTKEIDRAPGAVVGGIPGRPGTSGAGPCDLFSPLKQELHS